MAALIINVAFAGTGDPIYLAGIAGACVEGAVGCDLQRPDVLRARGEIFDRFPIRFNFVDLSIRGSSGVYRALCVDREGEDFRLVGSPQELRRAFGIDAVEPSAMAGSKYSRSVAGTGEAPNLRLVGGEDGFKAGGEGELAIAIQRQAGQFAAG